MCLSKEDLVELMEILPQLTSTAITEKVLSVRKIYYNKRLWLNSQLSFEHWCLFYLTFYALLYEIISLDFYINKVRILFIFLLKIRTAALPTVQYSSYSICFLYIVTALFELVFACGILYDFTLFHTLHKSVIYSERNAVSVCKL